MSWPAATLVVGARVAYGSPMRCAASADAWAGWLVCERPDDAPRRPRLHRGPAAVRSPADRLLEVTEGGFRSATGLPLSECYEGGRRSVTPLVRR